MFGRVSHYWQPSSPTTNRSSDSPLIFEPPHLFSSPHFHLHSFPTLFSLFQLLPRVFTRFQLLSTVLESHYVPTHVYNLPQPFSGQTAHFWACTLISDPQPHSEPFPHISNLYHVFLTSVDRPQAPRRVYELPRSFLKPCRAYFTHFRVFSGIWPFSTFLILFSTFFTRLLPPTSHFHPLPTFLNPFTCVWRWPLIHIHPFSTISNYFRSYFTIFNRFKPLLNHFQALLRTLTQFQPLPWLVAHFWGLPPISGYFLIIFIISNQYHPFLATFTYLQLLSLVQHPFSHPRTSTHVVKPYYHFPTLLYPPGPFFTHYITFSDNFSLF